MLENRHEAVLKGTSGIGERVAWKAWKLASLNRKLMNSGNGKLKNGVVNALFKSWTQHHGDLNFSNKTFNELWKEKNGGK